MIVASTIALLFWLLTWVAWFFCLPGTKWFDEAVHYEDDTIVLLMVGTILCTLGTTGLVLLSYFPAKDEVPFGISVGSSFVGFIGWVWMYAYFGLTKIHKELRKKRNY